MNRLLYGITRLELIVVMVIALLIACPIPNNEGLPMDLQEPAIIAIRWGVFA